MKAAVYEGIEKIVVKDIPEPEINEREILIRIETCAICGTDIRIYHYGNDAVVPPTTTGHELAGTVVKVGSETSGFKEGDNVTIATSTPCLDCPVCEKGYYNLCNNLKGIGYEYKGGFAEYMVVPEASLKAKNLLKFPENLSFEEACLSEPFACVVNGQELSEVKEGDTVVIIGAGPIGCMHIEMARLNGAKKVILADLIQERLDLAKKDLEVDRFINTAKEDLKKVVMDVTGDQGAEVVIVAAPSGKAQEDALGIVAKRGRLNLFGGLPKTKPTATFMSNVIHYSEIFVHGSYGSIARQQEKALELFSTGEIDAKKFISFTFPLDEIIEGFKVTDEKKGYRVVIKMGGAK